MPYRPLLVGIGLTVGVAMTAAFAETKKRSAVTSQAIINPTVATFITAQIPTGYRDIMRRSVVVDGERVELARYERGDGRNAGIGGEHFSTVIDVNGRLKGFARMDLDLVNGVLPSKDEAREIAMDFLRSAAPDLLSTHKISWIDRHDEPLRLTRAGGVKDLTLTGMKVKMRNTADGRWFWVIVGVDRKVMVFERDIVWVTFPGHRKTEKWLHDSWLVENGHAIRAF